MGGGGLGALFQDKDNFVAKNFALCVEKKEPVEYDAMFFLIFLPTCRPICKKNCTHKQKYTIFL